MEVLLTWKSLMRVCELVGVCRSGGRKEFKLVEEKEEE